MSNKKQTGFTSATKSITEGIHRCIGLGGVNTATDVTLLTKYQHIILETKLKTTFLKILCVEGGMRRLKTNKKLYCNGNTKTLLNEAINSLLRSFHGKYVLVLIDKGTAIVAITGKR